MSAHVYDRAAAGTVASRLAAVLNAAAADRSYIPTFETKNLPQGSQRIGPSDTQGVARIPFDPASGVNTGTNRLVLASQVTFPSNVRLEVDSGVLLVDGTGATGMFKVTAFPSNCTMTRGDATRNGGYWSIDCSNQPTNLKSRLMNIVGPMTDWLVEWLDSTQTRYDVSNATTVLPFHSSGTPGGSTSPRRWIYRHHRNRGSGPGWGPNQIASLYDSWIEDITTTGGTACRFETDGAAAGVHNVHAESVFAENGNRVLTCTPHASLPGNVATSDHVTVLDVRGVSNWGGIFIGADGTFSNLVIAGGCIVAGTTAQDPGHASQLEVHQSQFAVEDNHTGASPTITGIGRSGSFAAASPGGSTGIACDINIARGESPPPTGAATLSATVINTGEIDLSWTAATGATSYQVYRSGTLLATQAGLTYADTGVSAGHSYAYSIIGLTSGSPGPTSNVVTASTPPVVSASATSPTRVAVSWTAVSGASSYRVIRDGAVIATISTVTYADTSVLGGTSYAYTVAAIISGAVQPPSSAVSVTTPTGAGSATQFPSIPGGTIHYEAPGTNTAVAYIGDSTVTPSGGGNVFTELPPGLAIDLDIANANQLWWAAQTGDVVTAEAT